MKNEYIIKDPTIEDLVKEINSIIDDLEAEKKRAKTAEEKIYTELKNETSDLESGLSIENARSVSTENDLRKTSSKTIVDLEKESERATKTEDNLNSKIYSLEKDLESSVKALTEKINFVINIAEINHLNKRLDSIASAQRDSVRELRDYIAATRDRLIGTREWQKIKKYEFYYDGEKQLIPPVEAQTKYHALIKIKELYKDQYDFSDEDRYYVKETNAYPEEEDSIASVRLDLDNAVADLTAMIKPYTAGTGILVKNNTISIDNTIATKEYVDSKVEGLQPVITSSNKLSVNLVDGKFGYTLDEISDTDTYKKVTPASISAWNAKVDSTDTRLSDARTPLAHTHTPSEVGLGNVVNRGIDTTPIENSENYITSGGVHHEFVTIGQGLTQIAGGLSDLYTYTHSTLTPLVNNKQPKLTAGTNITIDENNVISATGGSSIANAVSYLTEAPTADNPNGLIFVVLSSEPTTRYNGYFYIIKE